MNKTTVESINTIYFEIKSTIEKRISFFKDLWKNGTEDDIFEELIFCLLTPQSKARMAEKAVYSLKANNLIYSDNPVIISDRLNVVRFKNNKAKYIILAKNIFLENNSIALKKYIDTNDIFQTREWLVQNIKGYGFKEASHFLRNIGFGDNIAILDRHILRNLKIFDVINEIPKSITRKTYLEIEKRFSDFSNEIQIPLSHLDFVFWYKEAGEVFK